MTQTNEVNRKDLKIQALLEKISSLTTQYENQIADLRVDFTLCQQTVDALNARLAEQESPDEVIEAEGVSDDADDEN